MSIGFTARKDFEARKESSASSCPASASSTASASASVSAPASACTDVYRLATGFKLLLQNPEDDAAKKLPPGINAVQVGQCRIAVDARS